MPDITMCASETCEIRRECRRNEESGTVPRDRRQSWFIPSEPGKECPCFWPKPGWHWVPTTRPDGENVEAG